MTSTWRYLMVVGVLGACGSDPKGPSFSSEHPRIYIEQNRDRLAAALTANGPAAKRFKSIVDRWTGGSDLWGLQGFQVVLDGVVAGGTTGATAFRPLGRMSGAPATDCTSCHMSSRPARKARA